jgi:hypothetical protein
MGAGAIFGSATSTQGEEVILRRYRPNLKDLVWSSILVAMICAIIYYRSSVRVIYSSVIAPVFGWIGNDPRLHILNILIVLGLVVLTALCFFAAGAAIGSTYGPMPFVIFACAFLGLAIFIPMHRAQTAHHISQARTDIAAYYNASDLHLSVNDHWGEGHIPGCVPLVHHEMHQVRGEDGQKHYRFTTSTTLTRDQLKHTTHQTVSPEDLLAACQKQAPADATADSVLALS